MSRVIMLIIDGDFGTGESDWSSTDLGFYCFATDVAIVGFLVRGAERPDWRMELIFMPFLEMGGGWP